VPTTERAAREGRGAPGPNIAELADVPNTNIAPSFEVATTACTPADARSERRLGFTFATSF